eukprot:10874230-Karenia_brevis.AAC.1
MEKQLRRMAKRKARDTNGVAAEMLQEGGTALVEVICDLFNDILSAKSGHPAYWKITRLTVILKKGDVEDPSNYRPIAILSVLYKLFRKVLCDRVRDTLDSAQPADQAGYRRGFS